MKGKYHKILENHTTVVIGGYVVKVVFDWTDYLFNRLEPDDILRTVSAPRDVLPEEKMNILNSIEKQLSDLRIKASEAVAQLDQRQFERFCAGHAQASPVSFALSLIGDLCEKEDMSEIEPLIGLGLTECNIDFAVNAYILGDDLGLLLPKVEGLIEQVAALAKMHEDTPLEKVIHPKRGKIIVTSVGKEFDLITKDLQVVLAAIKENRPRPYFGHGVDGYGTIAQVFPGYDWPMLVDRFFVNYAETDYDTYFIFYRRLIKLIGGLRELLSRIYEIGDTLVNHVGGGISREFAGHVTNALANCHNGIDACWALEDQLSSRDTNLVSQLFSISAVGDVIGCTLFAIDYISQSITEILSGDLTLPSTLAWDDVMESIFGILRKHGMSRRARAAIDAPHGTITSYSELAFVVDKIILLAPSTAKEDLERMKLVVPPCRSC